MKLNLIEPTLFDQTGHEYMYSFCLGKASQKTQFELIIWARKTTQHLSRLVSLCQVKNYFYRPIRQLQKFLLYAKLCLTREPQVIFVATAGLFDLILLYFLSKYLSKQQNLIVLHFHQFTLNHKKQKKLLFYAKKVPKQMIIVTPTDKLTQIFTNTGFKSCHTIACPTYPNVKTDAQDKFSKILYAGAARADKGFPQVVKYFEYMRSIENNILFEIHAAPPSCKKYDIPSKQALEKLTKQKNSHLILHLATLEQAEYQQAFQGAICLLLYNQQDYHNKFSAVALDALYAGCPIITTANTWISQIVQQHTAGIVLENIELSVIHQAVTEIQHKFRDYSYGSKQAGKILANKHDAKRILDLLTDTCSIREDLFN